MRNINEDDSEYDENNEKYIQYKTLEQDIKNMEKLTELNENLFT